MLLRFVCLVVAAAAGAAVAVLCIRLRNSTGASLNADLFYVIEHKMIVLFLLAHTETEDAVNR